MPTPVTYLVDATAISPGDYLLDDAGEPVQVTDVYPYAGPWPRTVGLILEDGTTRALMPGSKVAVTETPTTPAGRDDLAHAAHLDLAIWHLERAESAAPGTVDRIATYLTAYLTAYLADYRLKLVDRIATDLTTPTGE